ncbi:MAG: hypothetical protein WDW38_000869 [Sanguina aurantia]
MSAIACKPACKAMSFKASKASVPLVRAPTAARMQVWQPNNNKFFETFSFLPPLTDDQIAKQVDYMIANTFTPCLEFANKSQAYVSSENANRLTNGAAASYYDNRYWTMWKLPMFGCRDGMQVLKEIVACSKAFPEAYIRLVAFDAARQVQVMGFLVQRPQNSTDFQPPSGRSI